jgi:hypothetical protein
MRYASEEIAATREGRAAAIWQVPGVLAMMARHERTAVPPEFSFPP